MDNILSTLFTKMEAAGRINEILFKFKVLDTDDLRIAVALNTMKVFETIPQAKYEEKSSKISVNLKNQANRIYISSKNNVEEFIKAWELYSKSIAVAPNKSQDLSLAYANRSALLMNLCKYTECLDDINRALELDYPNHLKGKLLCRKIRCLNILNEMTDIKDVIEEAKCWLENINLSNEEKEKFAEKLKINQNMDCVKPFSNSNNIKDFPTFVSHKEIPCASEALAIKYNDIFGRHIVTTRKINPGEILIMEKPYANFLVPESVYTHCSHCLQVHWAMIPCEFCIHAMYCSDKCKNEAWKQYHDIECAVTGYLLNLEFNKQALFSMRLAILALREVGSIKKLRKDVEIANNYDDPLKKGFAKNGLFCSNKYTSLYTLVTNTEKRSVHDLFQRALSAAVILYYLCVHTTLFGNKFDYDVDKICMNTDATYIGGLILRHMQIIPNNIHSYSEEHNIDKVEIGDSALPFCSLINHSCDPNVCRCSTKDYTIVFAIMPIEKDSQIFDNYGMHYCLMNKTEREEKLKQYYFKCTCVACKEDWPLYENLLSFHNLLTDVNIKRKIEKTLEKFSTYVSHVMNVDIEYFPDLLTDLSDMIDILVKYVPLPCVEVNNVVETLKKVFFLTYGNKFEIPKLS